MEFVYDRLLRLRIRREYIHTVGLWYVSTETRYLYDGMLMLSERTSGGTPTATYVQGSDLSGSRGAAGGIGGLLSRSTGYSAGAWSTHNFYHADGIGNITALLGAGQVLSANYRYDPFGGLLASSGTQATANPMRFSSKPVLVDKPAQLATLYYYGYRFYDPALHRWLNRDPIEESGGINLYNFVAGNPLSSIDILGLKITIDPNASKKFKDKINNCLCVLKSSPSGNKIYNKANDHQDTVVIREGDDAGSGGDLGTDFPAEITMYPKSINGVSPKTQRKMKKYKEQIPNSPEGCAVVLAHELGHSLGASDDPERGNNVWNYENPVRFDFNIPPRLTYRGKSVVPKQ